ncbi:MAG: hypothetical protein EOO48_08705 [Flavobacterium sp.]|nr:MAG: hypothetical protein EOO48_08705 [Flavobacterium sp.]
MFNSAEEGKNVGIISYLTIIGSVVAIFMNQEKQNSFASFHIRQALGIFISFFLFGYVVSYFDSWTVSTAFWLFFFILWVYGFLGALQGRMTLIPLLGQTFQKIFKSL